MPFITLDSSISYTFTTEGMNTITVQVSAGSILIQDTKDIAVHVSPSPNHTIDLELIKDWKDIRGMARSRRSL
ncbi:UNVERIFIED_CONTAM: hypothetical protein K2H54_047254 [Gekko kuhli]